MGVSIPLQRLLPNRAITLPADQGTLIGRAKNPLVVLKHGVDVTYIVLVAVWRTGIEMDREAIEVGGC